MQTVYKERQLQLKGLEDCNFKCLTECPLLPGTYEPNCIYDDPDIGIFDLFQYPEHEFWRWDHEDLVRPEPVNPLQTRCPRCFSTAVIIGYPYIECRNCGYNEPLIDFPISRYYHLALLQEVKGGRSKKGTPEIGAPFLLEKMKEKG